MMHKIQYLKHGKRRTPYCTCGWVGPKCTSADSIIQNLAEAQDHFVEHLREVMGSGVDAGRGSNCIG